VSLKQAVKHVYKRRTSIFMLMVLYCAVNVLAWCKVTSILMFLCVVVTSASMVSIATYFTGISKQCRLRNLLHCKTWELSMYPRAIPRIVKL